MTDRQDAFKTLEAAIQQLVALHHDPDDELHETVTDAVLVIGAQYIDEDGDRGGRVLIYPRDGSQPPYITQGLLVSANDLITAHQTRSED